jgi:ABC-2 type transport system permease protein
VTALGTVTRLRLRELTRQPTTLAMLALLPPVVVEVYGQGMDSFPAVGLAGGADPATVGRLTGTLFAVAFLAGLVGLFQVIGARRGDERLAVAGLSRTTMLAGRLATMAAVAVGAATVSFAVLTAGVDVAAPALAFGALVLAGLLYGLVGVLVGSVLPRELEGSLVLVFVADLDNVLSSGIFDVGWVAELAPLYHAHELFRTAVLDGEFAAEHLPPTLAYVAALLVLAFVAYGRSTGDLPVLGRWSA